MNEMIMENGRTCTSFGLINIDDRDAEKESVEERLMLIDRHIAETAQRGCELIAAGESVGRVNAEIEYMRRLYGRRDVIIAEAKREGKSEKQLYDWRRDHVD